MDFSHDTAGWLLSCGLAIQRRALAPARAVTHLNAAFEGVGIWAKWQVARYLALTSRANLAHVISAPST